LQLASLGLANALILWRPRLECASKGESRV
jgi:hypothetical protein